MATNYVGKMKQASWNETSMKETILVAKTNKVGLCLRKAAALEHLVCQSNFAILVFFKKGVIDLISFTIFKDSNILNS